MEIRFYGVRGSIPVPIDTTRLRKRLRAVLKGASGIDLTDNTAIEHYLESLPPETSMLVGGNTFCVVLRSGDDFLVVDAGTGLRVFGTEVVQTTQPSSETPIRVLITHTHWDHLQGFPAFLPAILPGWSIDIYSPLSDIEERFAQQQDERFFPLSLYDMAATITFTQLLPDQPQQIGPWSIATLRLPHPGGVHAYRIEHNGASVVCATDVEYDSLDEAGLEQVLRFYQGADVLVFDAHFGMQPDPFVMRWGHSSAPVGVELAQRAGIKRIVLVHHDPRRTDAELWAMREQAEQHLATYAPDEPHCSVLLGYEGLRIEIP